MELVGEVGGAGERQARVAGGAEGLAVDERDARCEEVLDETPPRRRKRNGVAAGSGAESMSSLAITAWAASRSRRYCSATSSSHS